MAQTRDTTLADEFEAARDRDTNSFYDCWLPDNIERIAEALASRPAEAPEASKNSKGI